MKGRAKIQPLCQLPVVRRNILGRLAQIDAGRVDQNIGCAEDAGCRLAHGGDTGLARQVGRKGGTVSGALGDPAFQRIGAACHPDHRSPGIRKHAGRTAAEAGAGARDQRDMPVKAEHVLPHRHHAAYLVSPRPMP